MTFEAQAGTIEAMNKKQLTTAAQRTTDEQWAREKVRWTISNCMRSMAALTRVHREYAKRQRRKEER